MSDSYHGELKFYIYVNPVMNHAWEIVGVDGTVVHYHRNDNPMLMQIALDLEEERSKGESK